MRRFLAALVVVAAAACSGAPLAGELYTLDLGGPPAVALERGLGAPLPLPAPAPPPPAARKPVVVQEVTVSPRPHPFDSVPPNLLDELVRDHTPQLGSMSIGKPNRGALVNGVALPDGKQWVVASKPNSYGTEGTIQSVQRAIGVVNAQFPGTPPLYVGDISKPRGGYLRPHRSHQSGLDVDLGYYYTTGPAWYVTATPENLDRKRTWALIKALFTGGNVEYIFMSRRVQKLVREHAEALGEDPAWLERLFDSSNRRTAVIRHTWGHDNHMHVRFYDNVARETARRSYERLVRFGKLWPSARRIRFP